MGKSPQLRDILSVKKPKGPLDRLCIHIYLECQGFQTPDYGIVGKLCENYPLDSLCVCWLYGENQMMTLNEAYNKWPTNYAALHVGQTRFSVCLL